MDLETIVTNYQYLTDVKIERFSDKWYIDESQFPFV